MLVSIIIKLIINNRDYYCEYYYSCSAYDWVLKPIIYSVRSLN